MSTENALWFWNASGLTREKFNKLKKMIYTSYPLPFLIGIIDAGNASTNRKKFQITGYRTKVQPKSRKNSSGITIFYKSTVELKIGKSRKMNMTKGGDKLEGLELLLRSPVLGKLRVFVMYNPPKNKPDLTWLEWDQNIPTLLYADFNAISIHFGYSRTTPVGRILESFINSNNNVHYIGPYAPSFVPTRGLPSRPDVTLANKNIADRAEIKLLEAPNKGTSGHKILSVTLAN